MIQKPRTVLIYGESGIGKTSNLAMIAKWFYDKYKLKIRMIHSDGGGYESFNDESDLIGKGIVEVFDNTKRDFALCDIHRLCDGCWIDKNGELIRETNLGGNGQPINLAYRAKRFEKDEIGAYFVEGTGSLGAVLESHLSDKLVEGAVGFERAWKYQENEYSTAGLTPGHYKFIQTELHKIIVGGFGQLPVKLLVFTGKPILGIEVTSRTKKSGEKYASASGEPVYGPESSGIALTTKIPSWFGSCLHMEERVIKKGDKKENVRIAWYQRHTRNIMIEGTPTDVPYLAKSSCPIPKLQDLYGKFPGGFVQLGYQGGIDKYLEFLDGLEKR